MGESAQPHAARGRCARVQLQLQDAAYPEGLRALPDPPRVLTTSGPLEHRRAIAIVGSRDACDEALVFAHKLAFQLASAGIVVISGGAVGIDGAAHRGALLAGGSTWVVSPTGQNRLYPPQHRALFREIAASERSRMIWPFPDDASQTKERLRYRNGVLSALSEAVIMVQAHHHSGSRNASSWARGLKRPVWAVTAAPWMGAFCGSLLEISMGWARPLCSAAQLFEHMGLPKPAPAPPVDLATLVVGARDGRSALRGASPDSPAHFSAPPLEPPPEPLDMGSWSPDEILVYSRLSALPMHADEVVDQTSLPVGPAVTALLTLSLKDVVVESPDGFFRRRSVA